MYRLALKIHSTSNRGIFQGSLSGPILFIVFVNDMASNLEILTLILLLIYADDTTILLSLQGTKAEIQVILNRIMEELTLNMATNGLKFNSKKTQFKQKTS